MFHFVRISQTEQFNVSPLISACLGGLGISAPLRAIEHIIWFGPRVFLVGVVSRVNPQSAVPLGPIHVIQSIRCS